MKYSLCIPASLAHPFTMTSQEFARNNKRNNSHRNQKGVTLGSPSYGRFYISTRGTFEVSSRTWAPGRNPSLVPRPLIPSSDGRGLHKSRRCIPPMLSPSLIYSPSKPGRRSRNKESLASGTSSIRIIRSTFCCFCFGDDVNLQ